MTSASPPPEPDADDNREPATQQELDTADKHRKIIIAVLTVFILTPVVLGTLRLLGVL